MFLTVFKNYFKTCFGLLYIIPNIIWKFSFMSCPNLNLLWKITFKNCSFNLQLNVATFFCIENRGFSHSPVILSWVWSWAWIRVKATHLCRVKRCVWRWSLISLQGVLFLSLCLVSSVPRRRLIVYPTDAFCVGWPLLAHSNHTLRKSAE